MCQPGRTDTYFNCICQDGYYGTHCEYYKRSAGVITAIVLGTVIPFVIISCIVSVVVYRCCCRSKYRLNLGA